MKQRCPEVSWSGRGSVPTKDRLLTQKPENDKIGAGVPEADRDNAFAAMQDRRDETQQPNPRCRCLVRTPEQNERAALLAIFQQLILAPSTDRSLHVSDDGHLAVIRCGKYCVILFSDENGGLHETICRLKPKNVELKDAGD